MNKIPKGYKQTEIDIIPEDWDVKTISEISNPVRGGSPRPAGDPKYFNGKFIPWLTVAALTNIPLSQIYVSETENYLTEEGSLHSRILEKDTLIIANSGATLGVAKLLAIKCCANDGIAALQNVNNDIDKKYLVHFINTKIKYLREVVATGNGQPNLNTDLIGNIKFPCPVKKEQTAIATALSDADALISSLEKLIEKKRNIKQGAMQKLLQPNAGWEVKKLGEIAEIMTGNTPPTNDRTNYGEDYFFVSPADLGKGKWILDTEKKLSSKGYNISRKFPRNSILFTCIGSTIGKSGIAERDLTSNQQINAILPNDNYSSDYLYYALIILSNTIKSLAGEQAVPLINKTQFCETAISLPSIEKQIRIATILSDMDAEIEALETKLEKYRNIKLGMMQNLLTGKIRLV